VDINFDTNTSKQCICTLGHAVFVGYNVFPVRCKDGDAVLLQQRSTKKITWTYDGNVEIGLATNTNNQ